MGRGLRWRNLIQDNLPTGRYKNPTSTLLIRHPMPDNLVLVDTRGLCGADPQPPAQLNSFTMALHGELLAALEAAAQDAAVRALVVTGAGRGFCAGQDLNDPTCRPPMAARPTSAA
jgi:hypothetical protein